MVQCRRALKPDGLFLSAMWGGNTLQVVHAFVLQVSLRCLCFIILPHDRL